MSNQGFQAVCEAAAARWEVPALAAGVSVGDAVDRWTVGCDVDTVFRIASVTKPLTALLAVELLDLDGQTGVWPEEVRVRHLLSHTSGFDCELPELDLARFGDGDGALAAAVAQLPRVRRLVGADELWSYANTGYWLAGHLAAERAEATYEDALAEHVLRPLGLEATSFGEPGISGTGPAAKEGPYPRARRPSGGLTSTVDDVLRLGQRLLAHPAFARMAAARGRTNSGNYGLGLFGEQVGGAEVWSHGGSYGGFQSSLLLVPSRDAVFAGLTNSSVGSQALRLVEDAFLAHVLGERRPEPRFVELAPDALTRFAGAYANTTDAYDVSADGGGLVVRALDGEARLRPIGHDTFQIVDGPLAGTRVSFPRDGLARFGVRLAARR